MTRRVDFVTDARGRRPSVVIALAQRWLPLVPPGGLLEVLATDPEAEMPLRAWTHASGDALVGRLLDGDVYHFIIRRADVHAEAPPGSTEMLAPAA